MPLLFSYGTLQQEAVQLSTFGRSLEGQADELPGFEQSLARIEDPQVVAASGNTQHANVTFNGRSDSRVRGTVFEITVAELAAADQYEQRAAYKRISVMLGSGKRAWVYVEARSAPTMITHSGGCHCGRVRFEVVAPRVLNVSDCDCSICSKSGYLHLIVPKSRFRLLSGEDVLATYQFNTGTARHLFCSVCGIKAFYVPRSHPDGYSVNARCLDQGTVEQMNVIPSDGKNWERTHPSGRGAPVDDPGL